MNCPFCGHPDSRVIDSRPDDAIGGVRRRRECQACSRRFTTLERVELGGVAIVKKDDRREEFDREKVIAGARRACEKRPIPSGAIEALADEVEQAVYGIGKAEIPSSVVGELVMERLKALDHIAYIRFASVYREFADLDDIQRELETLTARGGPGGPGSGQPTLLPESDLQALTRGIRPFPTRRRRGRPSGGRSNAPRALRGDDDIAQGGRS